MIQEGSEMPKRFNRIVVVLFSLCVCTMMHGETYYVDAQTGDDDHSGLSSSDAWKTLRQVNITTFRPGDTILFRTGQEWEGMLYPRGSGAEGRPIVISGYGSGRRPKIHGGHADPVDFEGIRTIQTVLLYNQQYWVISDLEITNMPDNVIGNFDDNGDERRRGIFVVASDTGELRSITIKNNYVHHVKGDDSKDFHGSGGIMLSVLGKKKPSFFNGVYILDNRVYMVNRTGIGVSSYWQRRPRSSVYPYSWVDEMGTYRANLNVVIRGNDLESIGGDGIVPQTSFKALMEYNKVDGAASRSEGHNVGLWAWNSDSVLIQHNEVCNTRSVRDGMAFDCDAYSVGHVYQYNFSHNNKGGFMLFHGHTYTVPEAQNMGHVIRFNISLNDGHALMHFYGSGQTQSVIHNNLFYNRNSKVIPIVVDGRPSDVKITDNIFHIPKMIEWTGVDSIGRLVFSGNIMSEGNKFIPENNATRKAVRNDLRQLLNWKESNSKRNETVNPKMIRQLWNSMQNRRKGV
jgi:hypothetical protein